MNRSREILRPAQQTQPQRHPRIRFTDQRTKLSHTKTQAVPHLAQRVTLFERRQTLPVHILGQTRAENPVRVGLNHGALNTQPPETTHGQ